MKHLVRVFALLLALTMVLSGFAISASAEESAVDSGCKVLVWTDAEGEHVIPYTDFSGWDRDMASWVNGQEYILYPSGYGGSGDYQKAGFRIRTYLDEYDQVGVVGLAMVQMGDKIGYGAWATLNTYENKISAARSIEWSSAVTGGAPEYPIKGIIFYDPEAVTDDPVNATLDTSTFKNDVNTYPVGCHVSGADGAALYAAAQSGIVVVKAEVRDHDYENGICTVCGADTSGVVACRHTTYDNGFCTACDAYQPAELNADNVYEISNAGQLYWFADKVNNDNANFGSADAILTADIVVNEKVLENGAVDTSNLRAWMPIGYYAFISGASLNTPYGGTFDGAGHTVSGLYMNSTDSEATVGLVGYLENGTVKNVGILDSFLAGTDYAKVAAIAGRVSESTVENCWNENIAVSGRYAGGIVGYFYSGTIRNCYNTGSVSGYYAGGIAGYEDKEGVPALIENCCSVGTVSGEQYAGGIVGWCKNDIVNCYYDNEKFTGDGAGGSLASVAVIEATGKTTAQFASGEVAYLLNGSTSEGDLVWFQTIGTDAYPVFEGDTVYRGYITCADGAEMGYSNDPAVPTTKPQHTFRADGFCSVCDGYQPAELNDDNVYEIGNAGQLYWFADKVNNDNASFGSADAVLTADILVNQNVLNENGDLSGDIRGFRIWTPVGFSQYTEYGSEDVPYAGTFDGAGHTVSGLYFTGNDNFNTHGSALFGRLTGTVKDLTLADSYICEDGSAGGIVDSNSGTIQNCTNFATVVGENLTGGIAASSNGTVTGCVNAGDIRGSYTVGGVLGQNVGTLEKCRNEGPVSGYMAVGGVLGASVSFSEEPAPMVRGCYNTGSVSGTESVGGVVGDLPVYQDTYPETTLEDCYNIGTVIGGTNAGGVVGSVGYGTVRNCYYLADGETDSFDGTTAKTTAQFASGEVAYLLGEPFGQNIDNGGENEGHPVFSDARVYYGYASCADDAEIGYTNNSAASDTKPQHTPNADGLCTVCGHQYAVSVTLGDDTRYYDDLALAIDDAETGTEAAPADVVLLADIALDRCVEIEDGVMSIDMNGFELSSKDESYGTLLISANVTIFDSGKDGKISGTRCGVEAHWGGTVTILNGTFAGDRSAVIADKSTMIIKDGTFTGGDYGLYVYNGGDVTIHTGSITGTTYGVEASNCIITIHGGTVSGGDGIHTYYDTVLTITGGTVTGSCAVDVTDGSTLTITGGTITGSTLDLRADDAQVTLGLGDEGVGATFPQGISISGITLKGILAQGAAYWKNGTMLMNIADDAAEISGGDVIVRAACDHSGNTNTGWSANGLLTHAQICSVCNNYLAVETHDFDHDTGICVDCDIESVAAATVDGATHYYMSYDMLQDALLEVADGSIVDIKLYQDMTGSLLPSSLDIHRGTTTLDLNGCTLGRRLSLLDGTLTIVDTAEEKGTIVNYSGAAIEYYGDRLIIDDSVDCTGEAEGHEAWHIVPRTTDKVPSVGTTGSEDLVLPEGCILLDINLKNQLIALTEHAVIHRHADADKNHSCDTCDAELSKCEDKNSDHKCDVCGTALSECADEDKNHKCDLCGKVLSECVDENKDYKCDICGAEMKKDEVIRLAGSHRWETALKVADEMKANLGLEKFDAIIIASGNDFADALAGSYLSTVKNAPILLGWGNGGKYEYLDTDNIEYIKANLAENGVIYILGGEKAVPKLYEDALKGYNVKRLGGANRFETNLLILAEAGVADGSEVLVCTSTNFADSLSASATAKPILLVFNEYGKLYGKQPEFLSGLKNCTFTVIGGESAVSADLAKAIETYGKVERLAGANRFETSVMVAQKYFKDVDTAVLAYAWNYPDGLCGGSLAYSLKAPLILTMTKYEAQAVAYAKSAGITSGLVLGGDTLISDEAVRSIFAMDAADEIIKK